MPGQSTLDLKLIPEYDGSGNQSVVEWFEKIELVCKLQGVDDVASVIPLRLSGGAFAVYLQLSEENRKKTTEIKNALLAAFAVDPFVAYEQFVGRKLQAGESPDVFLADLRRLASLFGGITDKGLSCAFVAGLPESVRQLLRAGSRMETLELDQILTRARAVIQDDGTFSVREVSLGAKQFDAGEQPAALSRRCYACNGLNHLARDCLARHQYSSFGRGQKTAGGVPRRAVRCYRCGVIGHIASTCSGKEQGEVASAPASSPSDQ